MVSTLKGGIYIAIVAFGLVALSFLGDDVGDGQRELEEAEIVTEYVTKYETVVVHSKEFIEVPVVKEVPVRLRYFRDTDELESFLKESDADHHAYIRATEEGIIDLRKYDCDDYAIALQNHAEDAGFRMNIQIVKNYKMPNGRFVAGHTLNSTIIGNKLYFIEPQTDDYWLEAYLD